jgi:arylesterase / paraoxonase
VGVPTAEIILHQSTGVIYLACSDPLSRAEWTPCVFAYNADKRSLVDYVASYDPKTNQVTPLTPLGFNSPRGLSLHGMDVVVSSSNPDELFIYLVNHRPPPVGDSRTVGADEAIEVFRTRVGEATMTHVHTFEDPTTMISLNDVVGSPDGQSVYFTNDASHKVIGVVSNLPTFLIPFLGVWN